jgi:hypothetical protein
MGDRKVMSQNTSRRQGLETHSHQLQIDLTGDHGVMPLGHKVNVYGI